jgi:hypothetical protein
MEVHSFSQDHISKGIMDLGGSREDILDIAISKIQKHSSKFIEGSNTIIATINGHTTTITTFVRDKKVISGNIYKGMSKRKVKNLIYD